MVPTIADQVLELHDVLVFHTVFYSSVAFDNWATRGFSVSYVKNLPWFKGEAPGRRGTGGEKEFLPEIKARLGVRDTKEYTRRIASQAGELEQPPSLEVTRERFSKAEACLEHIHPKESFLSSMFPAWHWGNLCLTTTPGRIAKGIKPYVFSGVEEARWWVGWLLKNSLLGAAGMHVSDMLALLLALAMVHDGLFPGSAAIPAHEGLSMESMALTVQHLVSNIITAPSDIQHPRGQGDKEQLQQQEATLEQEPPFYAIGQPFSDTFGAKVDFFCCLLLVELPRELAREFKEAFFLPHSQARIQQLLRWSAWCFDAFLQTLLAAEGGHYPHGQAVIPGVDDIPLGQSEV